MKQYELYCLLCVRVCVTQGSSSLVLLTKDFKAPEERKVSVHLWTLAASRHILYLPSHLQSRNCCRFTSVISSHEKTVKSDFPVCCGLTSDGSWPCQICHSSFTVCASPSDSCLMSGSEDGQIVFTGATPAYSCWGLRPNLTLQPAARCAGSSGCLQRYSGKHKYQVLREGLRHNKHHTSINLGNTFLHVL